MSEEKRRITRNLDTRTKLFGLTLPRLFFLVSVDTIYIIYFLLKLLFVGVDFFSVTGGFLKLIFIHLVIWGLLQEVSYGVITIASIINWLKSLTKKSQTFYWEGTKNDENKTIVKIDQTN